MNTRAYRLNLDQVELFFELCQELKADTIESRTVILNEMAKMGQVLSVTDTPKTKEEYISHMSKHFKILQVKDTSNNG